MSNATAAPRANRRYQENMPKLEMDLGTILQIKLSPIGGNASRTFQGEYIGVVHYKFLIIRLPSVPGLINVLLPKAIVEVQYQMNGSVHSFYAEIEGHTVKPAFLLFVSYPDRMSILEMRAHNRISCALPCSLHCPAGNGNGLIGDISKGGCKVVINLSGNAAMRQLEKDMTLVLTTPFTSQEKPVSISATVRSVEAHGPCISLGMIFGESKEFEAGLDAYLHLLQDLM